MRFKKLFVSTMGVMTLTTINAFRWQFTKYRDATKKWEQIEENLKEREIMDINEFE